MDVKQIKAMNNKDRAWYVKFWADYVKTHTDREWGKQQNFFINSLMQGAERDRLTAKDYLKIKGEKYHGRKSRRSF